MALLHEIAGLVFEHCGHSRLKAYRLAWGWTVDQAVKAFHAMCQQAGLGARGLGERSWLGWEAGGRPNDDYRDLLCRLFQTSGVRLGFAPDYTPAVEPVYGGYGIGNVASDLCVVAPDDARRRPNQAGDPDPAVNRRIFLAAGGAAAVHTALPASSRVLRALDIAAIDGSDTLSDTTTCMNDLITHYSQQIASSTSTDLYDDLLNLRAYAGMLLRQAQPQPQRADLVAAAGWLSNLLAVAASNLGDQGSAIVWCGDAERRSRESGMSELAGWAHLTRALIAYYQGQASGSVIWSVRGQQLVPAGTVAHAKLAAQEMRARAMLGDSEGMRRAERQAAHAIARIPAGTTGSGVFSIVAPTGEPPYRATSLLLVGQFEEAAAATRNVIGNSHSSATRGVEISSSYARALLILGLAEAGLGNAAESVAVGRSALNSTGPVWPTLVLAGKLDQVLLGAFNYSGQVAEYHALYHHCLALARLPEQGKVQLPSEHDQQPIVRYAKTRRAESEEDE